MAPRPIPSEPFDGSTCDPRVRPHLVCPRCRGELEDAPGWLACGPCGVRWPVVRGIPWLVPEHAHATGADDPGRRYPSPTAGGVDDR